MKGWRVVTTMACVLALTAACSPADAPLDARPGTLAEARNLARSVARHARCGALEDFDFKNGELAIFTCQMPGTDSDTFAIWTFFNATAKATAVSALQTSQRHMKLGPFYAVVQSQRPGESESGHGYVAFPGEPWQASEPGRSDGDTSSGGM